MPDDRRRWKCPECGKEFRIPAGASDPAACPNCEALALPPVVEEHTRPHRPPGESPPLATRAEVEQLLYDVKNISATATFFRILALIQIVLLVAWIVLVTISKR